MTWFPSGPDFTPRGNVDPPPKWLDLIERRPDLDSRQAEPLKVKMTVGKFMRMYQVQTAVNSRVKYVRDHGDDWRIADTEGDCEGYALAKMVRLLGYGWLRGALRMTLCYVFLPDRWQAYAVLQIETDHGTWVLDNRMKYPRLWTRLPYRWLWRERPGGETWERLLNTDGPALTPATAGGHE